MKVNVYVLKVNLLHVTLDVLNIGVLKLLVATFDNVTWDIYAIFALRILMLLGVIETDIIDKSLL